MAEIRWHIVKKEGNPKRSGEYLVTCRHISEYDGTIRYYYTNVLEYMEGWNCRRDFKTGKIIRDNEFNDVYAWAEIDHLFDELEEGEEEDE